MHGDQKEKKTSAAMMRFDGTEMKEKNKGAGDEVDCLSMKKERPGRKGQTPTHTLTKKEE
jgi:hypothetical protein